MKKGMVIVLWIFLCLAGGESLFAQEHSLVISTSGPAETPSNPAIQDEELLLFTPGPSLEPDLFFSRLSWKSVIGDGNGNGICDGVPGDVDGLHLGETGLARPTVYDFVFSLDTSLTFSSGEAVEDGDIFLILPGGHVWIIFEEEEISTSTGTSTIDVDGFTFNPAGDLIFSFDKDEETIHAGLIEENGGNPTIREGSILLLEKDTMNPHVLFTEEEVLAMVNNAVDVALSSIVDTQGLEMDPDYPGELLFTLGSSNSSVEGIVFSTANGGSIGALNGIPLLGTFFGFVTEEVLSALCLIPALEKPLRIETNEVLSVGGTSFLQVRVFNGPPGRKVQIVGSFAVLPITPPTFFSPPLTGTGYVFPDYSSPIFWTTATAPFHSLRLDSQGSGTYFYPTRYLLPETDYVIQAIDHCRYEASDGIILRTSQ